MADEAQTQPNDIASFIHHEGENHPMALREALQLGYREVLDRIDGLSEGQARWSGADGSVLDVLAEIVRTRRRCHVICTALAGGQAPRETELTRVQALDLESLTGARGALQDTQDKLVAFVDALWPLTDLQTRWGETPAGPLNCKEWVVWQRVLDRQQAVRLARITSAAGFPHGRPRAA